MCVSIGRIRGELRITIKRNKRENPDSCMSEKQGDKRRLAHTHLVMKELSVNTGLSISDSPFFVFIKNHFIKLEVD